MPVTGGPSMTRTTPDGAARIWVTSHVVRPSQDTMEVREITGAEWSQNCCRRSPPYAYEYQPRRDRSSSSVTVRRTMTSCL